MSAPTIEAVAGALSNYRYRFTSEAELHEGIEFVLREAAIGFEREVLISTVDRIDFLLEGGLGLEVKIKGGLTTVTRQLHRYAACERITGLVLFTTRVQLRGIAAIDRQVGGKPFRVVAIFSGLR